MLSTYDPDSHLLWKTESEPVYIPGSEGVLMNAFFKANGKILTRDRLFGILYDHKADTAGPRVLDVFIHRLRKRLAGSSFSIATARSIGFRGVGDLKLAPVKSDRCPCCGQEVRRDQLQ